MKMCVGSKKMGVDSKDPSVGCIANADFETSISSCGYGRFNYLLVLSFGPMACSQLFCSGIVAYILPAAECDLKLTEFQKGVLNSAMYIGTIIGGIVCGGAGDKLGRKKIMVAGFLADFVCSVAVAFVSSFWPFFLLRILSGFLIAAPNSLMFAYLAETHSDALRAKTIMLAGMGFAIAGLLQPVLAYAVIPLQFRASVGFVEMTSWRVFILLSIVPSLLSGIICCFLPESPKFLMSQCRQEEALRVFRRIYAMNTRQEPSTFPVTSLSCKRDEDAKKPETNKAGCLDLQQFGAVMQRPYITRLVHTSIVYFVFVMCMNTMRLWTPQLFATLDQNSESDATVCGVVTAALQDKQQHPVLAGAQHICQPVNGAVYLRSVIIGAVNTCSFLFTSSLIGWIGKRSLILIFFPGAAAVSLSFSWAVDADWLMALLAAFTMLTANCDMGVTAVQVDLFPTSIRALAYSVMILSGRLATVIGNLILPVLLAVSCELVFYSMTGCLIVCFLLSWMLPNTKEDS